MDQPVIVVELENAAIAEARRLLESRALARECKSPIAEHAAADGCLVTIAETTRLRAALRGRTLQLWRVTIVNADGREIESTLIAVAIDADVVPASGALEQLVEHASVGWRAISQAAIGAFASARMMRERSIANSSAAPAATTLQWGLFDQRVERAHAERAAARAASVADQQARITALERLSASRVQRPYLVLSLVPRR